MTVDVPALAPVALRQLPDLHLRGPSGLDQLDPVTAGHGPNLSVLRLLSRQLLTFPAVTDLRNQSAQAPVGDLVELVPSTYNMGLGASHRSYVFHLKADAYWDTDPVRRVTAADVVRGFKRLCTPVLRPRTLGYLTNTVRGLADYCQAYAEAIDQRTATPAELAGFARENEIEGVFALDDVTLVVELIRAAPDFTSIATLPCLSAAPVEYEAYLPGSRELDAAVISNGPYRVARHRPDQQLTLEPNLAWRSEADPVRAQRFRSIVIDVGDDRPAPDHPAGAALLEPTPTPRSYQLDPYLAFNRANGSLLDDLQVRKAISLAIDRPAIVELVAAVDEGRDTVAAHALIPPNNDGHRKAGVLPAPESGRADARMTSTWPEPQTSLRLVHSLDHAHAEVAAALAAQLGGIGLQLRCSAHTAAELEDLLCGAAAELDWDLALVSWSADWIGNNQRAFLQPLIESGSQANVGRYRNEAVDEAINEALDAVGAPPPVGARAWSRAEQLAQEDMAIVPILFRGPAPSPLQADQPTTAMQLPSLGYIDDLATMMVENEV